MAGDSPEATCSSVERGAGRRRTLQGERGEQQGVARRFSPQAALLVTRVHLRQQNIHYQSDVHWAGTLNDGQQSGVR
jgi:hypothetical protein